MPATIIRIQDIADILIMTFLLYQLFSWFKGTRAMQVLLGLGVVTLIYFLTRYLGLYMTSWILEELGTVLIVLIIVVFQAEIRQTLYRFSLLRHLFDGKQDTPKVHFFQEIAETVFSLSRRRTGAILVFQRNESLLDQMLNGVRLDCEISPQILEAVFTDGTPLHDGAALIRDGRLALASCHLPLSVNPELPQYLGTRHRAGIGLSERTDAVVVIISEERGEVSISVAGELRTVDTVDELITILGELISPVQDKSKSTLTVPDTFFRNLVPKTAILLIVIVSWAMITNKQSQITTIAAPVMLHGIPEELSLIKSVPEEVDVQLKSFSSLAPAPAKLDLRANLDLSRISEGQSVLQIRNSDFKLPSGMSINAVTPSYVKIFTEKKISRVVPVRPNLRGVLPDAKKQHQLIITPDKVQIEGPASQISRIDSISTEEIDASGLVKEREYRKMLVLPMKRGVILSDETVVISFKKISLKP